MLKVEPSEATICVGEQFSFFATFSGAPAEPLVVISSKGKGEIEDASYLALHPGTDEVIIRYTDTEKKLHEAKIKVAIKHNEKQVEEYKKFKKLPTGNIATEKDTEGKTKKALKKTGQALINTGVFPILNPDILMLILLCICVITVTALITLIFVEEATVVKVLVSFITSVLGIVIAIGKAIIPKGVVTQNLEHKFFPPGNTLRRTQGIILEKLKEKKDGDSGKV